MSKSTFEEIILENSLFMENITTNERYKELLDENDKIYKKLTSMLTAEQIEILDKLIFNHLGMEAEATECYLEHGFKAGLKLLAECL